MIDSDNSEDEGTIKNDSRLAPVLSDSDDGDNAKTAAVDDSRDGN